MNLCIVSMLCSEGLNLEEGIRLFDTWKLIYKAI